jgi:putative SOS response-associated peptidase YedK
MTLTDGELEEIAADLDAELSPEHVALYRPRYNVAPSDLHWVVERGADRRVIVPAIWGYLASGKPLINVRGEPLAAGKGIRDAFQSRRCLVVTDGFFEWDRDKSPFWYHRAGGGLVLLAGLYQEVDAAPSAAAPPPAVTRARFTVLTTRPNKVVSAVHDRMPVVIASDRADEWLTAPAREAAKLIAPAPDDALIATRVSKRVNSVRNDDPECLTPAEAAPPAPPPAQRSLF